MPKRKWLSVEDFEFICFSLARELLTIREPIPDFCTRNNELLESSLAAPKQTFSGKLLHPTLIDQTATLFYSLIKNHPFENGNKRLAIIAIIVFLYQNGKWLNISPLLLYEFSILVAESKTIEKHKIFNEIKKVIKNNIIDRNK